MKTDHSFRQYLEDTPHVSLWKLTPALLLSVLLWAMIIGGVYLALRIV